MCARQWILGVAMVLARAWALDGLQFENGPVLYAIRRIGVTRGVGIHTLTIFWCARRRLRLLHSALTIMGGDRCTFTNPIPMLRSPAMIIFVPTWGRPTTLQRVRERRPV